MTILPTGEKYGKLVVRGQHTAMAFEHTRHVAHKPLGFCCLVYISKIKLKSIFYLENVARRNDMFFYFHLLCNILLLIDFSYGIGEGEVHISCSPAWFQNYCYHIQKKVSNHLIVCLKKVAEVVRNQAEIFKIRVGVHHLSCKPIFDWAWFSIKTIL